MKIHKANRKVNMKNYPVLLILSIAILTLSICTDVEAANRMLFRTSVPADSGINNDIASKSRSPLRMDPEKRLRMMPDIPTNNLRAHDIVFSGDQGKSDSYRRGDKISFELFDGRTLSATVSRVRKNSQGTVSIVAKPDLYPMGHLILTTTFGESYGTIDIPETAERYRILPSEDRSGYSIVEIPAESVLGLEGAPSLIPPPAPSLNNPPDYPSNDSSPQNGPLRAPESNDSSIPDPVINNEAGPDDPATVAVMIVYTPAAKANRGGEAAILNTIQVAVEKAQLVHDNSGTGITLSLVHSAEVSYVESGTASTDLQRLTETSDGYMDDVHDWRNQYSADYIALFTLENLTGGVGWVLNSRYGRDIYAFCVCRVQQAATYTYAHELGHNMGLSHHKTQIKQPGPTDFYDWVENTWTAGWRWEGSDTNMYCTVMTYDGATAFPDGKSSIEVPYFSNPNVNYSGDPTGHATKGDGVRTLKAVKHYFAAYRTSETLDPVTNTKAVFSGDDGKVSLSWNTPSDGNYYGTLIRYSTSDYPQTISDGVKLAKITGAGGVLESTNHNSPPSDKLVYYTFWAYNSNETLYSDPANAITYAGTITRKQLEQFIGNIRQGGDSEALVKSLNYYYQ